MPSARFFNQTATIRAVAYPQDAAGGEVPTPGPATVAVPCCVQQDSAAGSAGDGQGRRGSEAEVRLFFRPAASPQRDAVAALKVNDRVAVSGPIGPPRAIILDGPPHDASGRGVVWEGRGRDVR
jgi:hypothetical protein